VAVEHPSRIVLRPLRRDEAQDLLAGRRRPDWSVGYPTEGDRNIARFLLDGPAHAEPGGPFSPFQIVVVASGLVVGGIGCHRPPDSSGSVEIGYGIAPEWRNQGLTTEAVLQLLDRLRDAGVARVTARTAPSNLASQAILRRTGFAEQGRSADDFLLWELHLAAVTSGPAAHELDC
jgi:RimJ/RimL family protein N-acetyltransferase